MTKGERRVVAAALHWWRQRRPIGWTEQQHLDEPRVNAINDEEIRMALVVAELVSERRKR